MAQFIEINGDLFNVEKIQAITYSDEKNVLGNESGVYILEIRMEREIGSIKKAYSSKKIRDEDLQLAKKQLLKSCTVLKGYGCK